MKNTSTPLLALCLALLAGCSGSSSATGSAQFVVSTPQALSSTISRITVTASAADFDSRALDLVASEGGWGGQLDKLPPGSDRSFLAQAFDASGTLLIQGSASGVSISAGQTSFVAITLQPPASSNEAPGIDSLVADSNSVYAGDSLSLVATAHDPDPGDTLSYAWSSTAGSFSSASSASTSWTAPDSTGPQTLTLTVTDSQGLAASLSLTVDVTAPGTLGDARFSISFNTWPQVASIRLTVSPVAVGKTTSVSVSASDVDGDSLAYSWSTSCMGSLTHPSSSTALFTPVAVPAGACNNCRLTVSVSDRRGGQTTGSVALCVSDTPTPQHFNPFLTSFSGPDTVAPGQTFTFEVAARDPEGSALSFSWAATKGPLGAPVSSASTSRITWTAPACVPASLPARITATVTNAFNLTTTRVFALSGLPVCAPAVWTSTGSMAQGRDNHTATLLPDGKVLVVGGYGNTYSVYSGYLATVEVYDPASGTWSRTGSMSVPRSGHTATPLPGGKVLVAGGYNDNGDLATAEVYDPALGTWSATGSMTSPRSSHTATRLADGKVLVAAGRKSPGEIVATAEVYDPGSGTWSTTGSMASLRVDHTATLLPGGKVLVTGGQGGYIVAKEELYDPASGTWSLTGALASPRAFHTATPLPGGKVLVTGGFRISPYDPVVKVEVYDPASGTWSETGTLVTARSNHTATPLPDGTVLVTGGSDKEDRTLKTAEVHDAAPGLWSATASMATPREYHTATLLPGGKVLVVGGYGSGGYLGTAELYTPEGPSP